MVDQTSQFYALLTNVGAAKQANADALGIPWKITQMAVGDGNPNGVENPALPMPDAAARALLNEWRRAPLNQLKVDDKDSSIIVAEQVIPADVGGRWIREIALYDADGDMVAVANCAPTYKPLLSQGSGRTQVVRMNLVVSSASNVQLKIDPSVVLATREWVTEELAKQDFKHSVLVATTAAVTLSGLQTVDGVALTAGARVLVKHQAAAKDNGLYQVVAGGPWTRCADAGASDKVTPGLLVLVEKGSVNADSAWQLVADGPITLGVTALVFEMVFGRTGVAAGTYRSVTVDAYGRVVAASNPTTVAGYGLTDVYTKTQVDQALALKANLVSPALTGVPTAPTAAVGTNTAQLANTAFVTKAVGDSLPLFTAIDSTTDWNTITAPGWFSNILSVASPNSPGASASYYYCLVLKYSTSATQVAFPYGAGAQPGTISYRSLYQGVWTVWSDVATLFSPQFTGIPKAPTAAVGTNTAQIANTAFVQAAIASLVASSPAALDTLNELAAALGNDPNFATTITNLLALKAPLASPVLTGTPQAPTAPQFDVDLSIASTAFVQRALGNLNGSVVINDTISLTAAHCGVQLVGTVGLGGKTVTLPSITGVVPGAQIHFSAGANTTPVTIAAFPGEAIAPGGVFGGSQPSFEMAGLDSVVLVHLGGSSGWRMVGGSQLNKHSSMFGFLVGSHGYVKHPSGITIQWVNGQIPAGAGSTRITLPFAFSTSLLAYSFGTANAGHWVTGQNASPSGVDIIARTVSAGNIIVPPGVVGYTGITIGI